MSKRKSVDLTGKQKHVVVECRKCGCSKRLEYRKFGRKRKLYGAYEAPRNDSAAETND